MAGDFPAPGIEGGAPAGDVPTRCRLWPAEEARAWFPVGAEPLAHAGAGPTLLEVHVSSEDDFLMRHATFGRFRISRDGHEVACAPELEGPAWRWQRFLAGQVLPLVAVLRGHEVLHASAVSLGDHAVLLAGPSGAGKTTGALRLLSAGATLVADDVATLRSGPGGVVVESGARLTSVSQADDPLVSEVCRNHGGRLLGRWEGEVRLTIPVASKPVRVGAVVVLDPRPVGDRVDLDPLQAGAARRLLGLTFNAYIVDRDRLMRQLDMVAALARQVPIYRATVPRNLDPALLSEAVLDISGPIM